MSINPNSPASSQTLCGNCKRPLRNISLARHCSQKPDCQNWLDAQYLLESQQYVAAEEARNVPPDDYDVDDPVEDSEEWLKWQADAAAKIVADDAMEAERLAARDVDWDEAELLRLRARIAALAPGDEQSELEPDLDYDPFGPAPHQLPPLAPPHTAPDDQRTRHDTHHPEPAPTAKSYVLSYPGAAEILCGTDGKKRRAPTVYEQWKVQQLAAQKEGAQKAAALAFKKRLGPEPRTSAHGDPDEELNHYAPFVDQLNWNVAQWSRGPGSPTKSGFDELLKLAEVCPSPSYPFCIII